MSSTSITWSSHRPNQTPNTSIKTRLVGQLYKRHPSTPLLSDRHALPSDSHAPSATPLLPQRQRPSQNRGLTGPKASVHPTATSCRASDFQHQSEQNSAKLYFHNPIIPPHFSITRISGRYAAFILVLSEKVPTPQKCPRSAASRSMHPPNS